MTTTTNRTSRPALTLAAVSMLVAAVVLTLLCVDFSGDRGPRPPWFLALPAVCGLLGGAAGLRARRPVLGVTTGLMGLFALPAAIVVTTLVSGP